MNTNLLVPQNQQYGRASNLFSQIIDDTVYQSKKLNPQFMRIKNNILLIMLVLASYAVYYLFNQFLNTILLAFIAAIGYQQTRDRFILLIKNARQYPSLISIPISQRIIKSIPFLILLIMLPWFRYILTKKQNLIQSLSIYDVFYSQILTRNLIIRICQLYLLGKIIKYMAGPQIEPFLFKIIPTNKNIIQILFAIIFIIFSIFCLISIPIILTREISSVGASFENKIQQKFGCMLMNYSKKIVNSTNSAMSTEEKGLSQIPFCSSKIFSSSQYIKKALQQFRNQSEMIENCKSTISGVEQRYIGYQIFDSQEIVCQWFSLGEKITRYIFSDTQHMMITTGNIFTKAFGHLTYIINSFSNVIFSVTTFITIFCVTVSHFDPRNSGLQQIFHGQRRQLISQITNFIQGTLFIVIEHFGFSLVILQVFYFSDVNLLLAITLSSMAFFPFIRPWFGITLLSLLKAIISGQWFIYTFFIFIYYLISEKIYSNCYKKMQIHEIFINMSVLFGIYQFGVAGIFYGPVIIILFQSVQRELLRIHTKIQQ